MLTEALIFLSWVHILPLSLFSISTSLVFNSDIQDLLRMLSLVGLQVRNFNEFCFQLSVTVGSVQSFLLAGELGCNYLRLSLPQHGLQALVNIYNSCWKRLICFCCHCSITKLCSTLCNPMDCSTPSSLCTLLSPWVCSNSRPLSWWCPLTTSSSVPPFFSCPQAFPA